jgi:hypothetical protein
MTIEQQICELLLECTPNQQDFFKKLYPSMPSKKQQEHALFQIRNSIERNKVYNKEVEERNEFERLLQVSQEKLLKAADKIHDLEYELKELRVENAELKLNPIENIKTKDLLFLEALRSAGVDNWDGYSHAQDIYEETLLGA